MAGVSAVLFDEVHERSLDSDFGLALALDAQGALRPDLRIVPMSATLDGARFAALLDDAPVIESEGRIQPLELRHVGRMAEKRIEDEMAAAIRRALGEEAEGDLLAFLPGVAEIERTAERIEGAAAEVHRLHGSLDPAAQRAAIRRDPEGRRRIVLVTAFIMGADIRPALPTVKRPKRKPPRGRLSRCGFVTIGQPTTGTRR